MPPFEAFPLFLRELAKLTRAQQGAFLEARDAFVKDLRQGHGFSAGLRVKRVQGERGVWEMTWAPDGRATFEYGVARRSAEAHIVWRRIGTHDIFRQP